MVVRWRSDFDKFVVVSNCEKRGWVRWVPTEMEDWNFYWANVHVVKQIFNPENGVRLGEHQMVNHFPNHYELTRKDLMVKNFKRYRKDLERDGLLSSSTSESSDNSQPPPAETGMGGFRSSSGDRSLDFLPLTFSIPSDYSLFQEEFRRFPHSTWIMKPTSKAQGKGIFLINRISQVKKWMSQQVPSVRGTTEPYIVSRYIDNPLLIGGRKFDLRMYVAVTSYRPLKAHLSSLGFARFCNSKYTSELSELDNNEVHLTNVAIQKHGDTYNDKHGNKWPLASLKLFLQGTRGEESTTKLLNDINAIIVHSLKSVQNVMVNDRHCFELYGYDIIVDDNLKPWLIEVNASPSLSATTDSDRMLKCKVISDVISLAIPSDFPEGRTPNNRTTVGSFTVLVDEECDADRKREARFASMRNNYMKKY